MFHSLNVVRYWLCCCRLLRVFGYNYVLEWLGTVGEMVSVQKMQQLDWGRSVMMKEFILFSSVGVLNTLFAWVLYEILYILNVWPGHAAVAAWSISCAIGMVESHYVHYKFTFKSSFPYRRSLYRAIVVYASQLIVTTWITYTLVEGYGVHHRLVWLFNTCVFGFFNFLMIRLIAFPPKYDINRMKSSASVI